MGGMVAQDLTVRHPGQVRRLILCATYPGTGGAALPSQAAERAGHDFPANQGGAARAFMAAIAEYPAAPPAPQATRTAQAEAETDWVNGADAAGRKVTGSRCPR
jgi:pimeloyl-ACP methyl ester carboxylesterase